MSGLNCAPRHLSDGQEVQPARERPARERQQRAHEDCLLARLRETLQLDTAEQTRESTLTSALRYVENHQHAHRMVDPPRQTRCLEDCHHPLAIMLTDEHAKNVSVQMAIAMAVPCFSGSRTGEEVPMAWQCTTHGAADGPLKCAMADATTSLSTFSDASEDTLGILADAASRVSRSGTPRAPAGAESLAMHASQQPTSPQRNILSFERSERIILILCHLLKLLSSMPVQYERIREHLNEIAEAQRHVLKEMKIRTQGSQEDVVQKLLQLANAQVHRLLQLNNSPFQSWL